MLYRPAGGDGRTLFRSELDELARNRGVRVVYLTSEQRTLSTAVIRRLVPDIARRDVFVCGSPPMVAATRNSLIEAGCSRRHIFQRAIRAVMRRVLATLVVTVVAVIALFNYRTHLPQRMRAPVRMHARSIPRPHPAGTRAATGVSISTPFTTIQVRAFVLRGRLIDVQEVDVEDDNAHTKALNDRAIPILHEEVLSAGSAHIDLVSGATGTSTSYISSLQSAIDRAHG